MKKSTIVALVEAAILIAMASILSEFALFDAPLGGKITLLSMLPIMFISFRRGLKWGFATGFVYSIIQLILGLNNLTYVPTTIGVVVTIFFDYIIPYTLLGISGIFFAKDKNYSLKSMFARVFAGVFLACLIRFSCHLFSGAVIWYDITKEGQWNDAVNKYGPLMYSFVYNIFYMGPETALVLVASPIIIRLKDVSKA